MRRCIKCGGFRHPAVSVWMGQLTDLCWSCAKLQQQKTSMPYYFALRQVLPQNDNQIDERALMVRACAN